MTRKAQRNGISGYEVLLPGNREVIGFVFRSADASSMYSNLRQSWFVLGDASKFPYFTKTDAVRRVTSDHTKKQAA